MVMLKVIMCLWAAAPILAYTDYSQYVNPFIGGQGPIPGLMFGGGDIFVGGAVPFGVAKVGIDSYEPNVTYSVINGGWTPAGLVTAISMMHVSGTGGDPKYGIIPQMPLTSISPPVNVLDNTTYWQRRVGNDTARVGYYSTKLENGVTAELSASRHAGIMQYSFPAGEKHVLVDVSHYLPNEYSGTSGQVFLGGKIGVNGSTYSGHGTFGGGWNEGAPFTVFFCGEFDSKPDQAQTFHGRNTDPMQRYHTFSNGGVQQATFGQTVLTSGPLNDRVGAVFSWNAGAAATIRSRVGISFISEEKACSFKDEEIRSWNLNDTVSAAVTEWNTDVLSKIQVPLDTSGGAANHTNLVLLYSSLYFMHLQPSDRTGENPLWEGDEPSWDDFYAIWDIFRCTVSLYHLLQPARYEGMIRALIDIWRWEGYMPDGRSGNYNGLVQGGSNADNVLADAYVKGLRGAVNWTAGYLAMLKDAEVMPYNTFSLNDVSSSEKEGRGALDNWHAVGYVAAESSRSISRTVEYSLNDYAVSVVAAGVAPLQAQKYLKRSAGWQKIWNANVTSKGFKGFLAPKQLDGKWIEDFDPAGCGGCETRSYTYEGTPWEYSFTVPFDMSSLIEKMGGSKEFERRMDFIFMPHSASQDLGPNGAGITTIMNIGNEPDFGTPYLFNYINKQWKSVNQSRHLANQYFHDDLVGVPGNSDGGALNSWLVWQMLGLYPIVTQPVYLLQSPWFNAINVTVNGNKTLSITSNGNATTLGQQGYYVQSVKVNGVAWHKNWISHEDVMVNGGTIDFTVGPKPVEWETGDVPPSPGHVNVTLGNI